jgi:hypothetical protein
MMCHHQPPADHSNTTPEEDTDRAPLLDSEGDLSTDFTLALSQIFQRFSKAAQQYSSNSGSSGQGGDVTTSEAERITGMNKLVLTEDELDEFTKAVNDGEVMNESSKEEMKEYLDVDKEGQLTVSQNGSQHRKTQVAQSDPFPNFCQTSLSAFAKCITYKVAAMWTRRGRI